MTTTTEKTTTASGRAAVQSAPSAQARHRSRTPWSLLRDWLDRPLASLHLLVAVFALMLGFGLLMVLSSSSATAFRRSESAFATFSNQALFAGLGLVLFLVVMRVPLGMIRGLSTPAMLVSVALLIAVLIPGIGSRWNGAASWITIGSTIQFQPSEIAKLAFLVWAAHVLAFGRGMRRTLKSLLIPVGPVFVLMVVLIMLEPDLGTTVTLGIIFLGVLWFAGAPMWIFGTVLAAGVGGVIVLANTAGYRIARLTAWLHPDVADPRLTYQSFQGYYAMGSGGTFGVGLGQSKMKWGRLPHGESDFIFAVIGEELGLVGALVVIVLFALLAYTGLRIARRNPDPFIKIAAAGGTVWLVGQAAINIGYVVGLLPVTGIPLPMFSAGGTSLVVTMVVFGLLANFARREPAALAALGGGRGVGSFLGFGRGAGRAPARAAGRRTPSARTMKRRAARAERVRQSRRRTAGGAASPRRAQPVDRRRRTRANGGSRAAAPSGRTARP